MIKRRILTGIFYFILLISVLGALPISHAYADSTTSEIPPGFTLINSTHGIELYRKDYKGGSPDFVQIINLSQGARVVPLNGEIRDPGTGKGVYGGSDARFVLRSMEQYWQTLVDSTANAFCVTNGQFFLMGETPTRLPFPLKKDGEYLTDGYGKNEFPDRKLMLEIWDGKADIRPLTEAALYSSTAPQIVAGLAEDANKRAAKYVGRTFVGVDDRDLNHEYETILILVTKTARQVDAAEVLRSFGAEKVMMLDGGGSAQLTCQGQPLVSSDRSIPQALGIIAGNESIQPVLAAAEPQVVPTEQVPSAIVLESSSASAAVSGTPVAVHMDDLVLIPALMLPVIGIVALVMARVRRYYANF